MAIKDAKNYMSSLQDDREIYIDGERIKDVTKDWVAPGMNFDLGDPEAREGLIFPNQLANVSPTNSFPNRIYTGSGRMRIHRMLQNVRLEKFPVTGIVDSLSLQDIIKDLHDTIQQIDGDGINIIIDQNTGVLVPSFGAGDPSMGGFDPTDPTFGGGFPQSQEREPSPLGLPPNANLIPAWTTRPRPTLRLLLPLSLA